MASKAYRLSGYLLKEVQAIAAGDEDLTEAEVVRELVRRGLGHTKLKIIEEKEKRGEW